jgi:hypothetical protein
MVCNGVTGLPSNFAGYQACTAAWVFRFPRRLRPGRHQPRGGPVVVVVGQVRRAEEDDVDVTQQRGVEAVAVPFGPDEVAKGAGADPGVRQAGVPNDAQRPDQPWAAFGPGPVARLPALFPSAP